jgi:mono/diheme cytochrome c family protein
MFSQTSFFIKRFGFILFFMCFHLFDLAAQPENNNDSTNFNVGKKLFTEHCAKCHLVSRDLIGPSLKNISQKREKEWLYSFIRNSQEMITDGDSLANLLYNQYEQVEMPAVDLKDAQIAKILKYIDAESNKSQLSTSINTTPEISRKKNIGQFIYGSIVIFLFLSLIIVYILGNSSEIGLFKKLYFIFFKNISKSFYAFAILILITIFILAYKSPNNIPEQPVYFSHQQHYETFGIHCVYCHQSAKKEKAANIPQIHVCMKCHEYIEEGEFFGKEEVDKLYSFQDKNEDINWIKGFRFDGFVKFDHSLHTINNKFECIDCHTNTEEPFIFEKDFSMQWCIDCHDQNIIDLENPYYSGFEDSLKVSEIGGRDCVGCHY